MADNFNLDTVVIRPVKGDECDQIVDMIRDMASSLDMTDQMKLTSDALRQDLFAQPERCSCLVAEYNTGTGRSIVGFVLYYPAYSTWKRTVLQLEALYVKPDVRRKGLGKKLLQFFTQVGLDMECDRMDLRVMEKNKPALNFCEASGIVDLTTTEGWRKMRMLRPQMESFVQM